MDIQRYRDWMDGFMNSWKNLEGAKTVEWLSKDVKYYENPDGAPCASFEEVASLWEIVPQNQRNISYNYEIICVDDMYCIYNWKMTRTLITNGKELHQKIDGIFQVKLDEDNKCSYFKQWRSTVTE